APPTYSGCGSYDWQVSPSYSGDYYSDNTSADAAEPPPPSPVTPSLPTWRNLYNWPNGHGYAGWHTASSSQSGAYGMQSALGGNYGLWLWPVGGSSYSYSQGQYAEWTYTAPGTTRITNATLQFTYKNKLLAHHCIDVGFRDTNGVVVTHNEHCTPVQPPDSQRDVTISLVDPAANPTSTTLYFRIRVDCGGATTCSKNIPQLSPLSTGGYARATKVDMTLVDDDNPEAWASGSFYDLAGDYTNGSSRFDLTFGANDAGSGVQRVWVERIGAGVIASSNAPCDPTHHTDALDNRICPDQYSAGITIDTSTMPEGRNQYFVAASDLAGNTDAQDPWSVSIDRTAPDAALAAATEWYDAQNGDRAVNWDIGTDPPLADGNSGSGVAQSRYRYSLNGGAFSDWETDPGAELVIPNARVGDRVTVEVRNLDGVDNATAATATTLTLDGTAAAPPQEDAALPDF